MIVVCLYHIIISTCVDFVNPSILIFFENIKQINTLVLYLVPSLGVGTHRSSFVTTRSVVTRGGADFQRAKVLQNRLFYAGVVEAVVVFSLVIRQMIEDGILKC